MTSRVHSRIAWIAACVLTIALVFSIVIQSKPASADEGAGAPPECGTGVNAEPSRPRYISLVIDDSGSMFAESGRPLDRWSAAKYSLEVFAVMLGVEDSLDVYRMSDFANQANAEPQLRLSGREPASSRVAKVHEMQLVGGGTPYAPVEKAMRDLAEADAIDKWLVVLSDGEFTDRETPDVISDFRSFITANSINDVQVRLAFMSIGEAAPRIPSDAGIGLFSAHASQSSEVLNLMTTFSNRIFQRSILPQGAPHLVALDTDLDELLVFAQGQDVSIGPLSASGAALAADSTVKVAWSENQDAVFGSGSVPAVPNKELSGAFASFSEVSQGSWGLDLNGAKTVDVFYRPKVRFGVQLRDDQGRLVSADRIVGGTYRLDYGFMNAQCQIITSELFGEVTYSARVLHDGEVLAENFAPGDQITLERGDVVLEIGASYLDGHSSEAKLGLQVLRPPAPSGFEVEERSFNVSELAESPPPSEAIALQYFHLVDGEHVPFSAEEWAAVDARTITVTSESNLEFDVSLGEEIGVVHIFPRAPGGDVYDADVGAIPVRVDASHVYDEQINEAAVDFVVTVVDDLSTWDRLLNWVITEGWKWLIALIGVILLCGYLFKNRFSGRIKPKPTISFMPRDLDVPRREGKGRFRINPVRKLLPFVADTATFTYVLSGASGFRSMKLRAGKSRTMQVVNWKQLAEKENVEINGTPIDKEMKRAPTLGATGTIMARDRLGTYESTPTS